MYYKELQIGLEAVDKATRYLQDAYEKFQPIPNAPAEISTEADRQSQEIILNHLLKAFPQDSVIAEETTETLQNSSHTGARLWIVDPIDGTRGFARKNGEFSVMVGFVENGEIAVGIVAQPAVGRLTYATRTGGCWRLDQADGAVVPCRVKPITQMAQATLTQSHSRDPAKRSPMIEAIGPGRIIESYSAGIKLALVARGEADLYLNSYEAFRDWDICAGHILVTEAGGTVTGIHGETLQYGVPGAWQKNGLLASNGLLHAEAVQRVAGCK